LFASIIIYGIGLFEVGYWGALYNILMLLVGIVCKAVWTMANGVID
jgi:hypothetical protein